MALLDPILPFVTELEVNDFPTVAQSMSTGGRITTVQVRPKIWTFNLTVETPAWRYPQYTSFLEDLRQINQSTAFDFTFQPAPGLHFRVPYQGPMSSGQQSAVRVAARQAGDEPNTVRLSSLPGGIAGIIRKGDFIQLQPGRVFTALYDVTASLGGDALVYLSDVVPSYPNTNTPVYFGPNVTWSDCYFSELPNTMHQSLFQGGITWTGSFKFTQST